MLEADGVSPHTAHTTNPVPLIVTENGLKLREDGELSDLAPTVLGPARFCAAITNGRPKSRGRGITRVQ